MENQIEGLTSEINKLGNKTIRIYEEGTQAEQFNVRKQLQKFQTECEDIFRHYIGLVPSNVINEITEQTNELLKKEIGDVRTFECRETMANLQKSKSEDSNEIKSGIESFKENGIVQENRYDQKVDEILDRVIKAYRSVLERAPSRKSEVAFDEIRGRGKRTFNNIKEVHEECSRVIKSEVLKETRNLEVDLSNIELNNMKNKIESKVTSDFGDTLQASCYSKNDVINNDVKDMYNNDIPEKNIRADLEAMFK